MLTTQASMTLMIVDDNLRMRNVIKSIFDEETHRFIEYGNGEDAVKNYATDLPDWVLMDVKMPVMDGITASKQILDDSPKANIIIVTEYNDVDLQNAARKLGTRGYVLKEDLEILKTIIH